MNLSCKHVDLMHNLIFKDSAGETRILLTYVRISALHRTIDKTKRGGGGAEDMATATYIVATYVVTKSSALTSTDGTVVLQLQRVVDS